MARVILSHNIGAVAADGSIEPTPGETGRSDESGHVAFALGEFYRATQETRIGQTDIVELVARCVSSQLRLETESENGLAYAALGLLSFGPSKERNLPWAQLDETSRELMDKRLLVRTDYFDHRQAFNIGKAVTRFSLGLSKKTKRGALSNASSNASKATARAVSATMFRARRTISAFSAVALICAA